MNCSTGFLVVLLSLSPAVAQAEEPVIDMHHVEEFTDIIGRNFRQPREGLGFDGGPTAHMWRTMIWPNNFL